MPSFSSAKFLVPAVFLTLGVVRMHAAPAAPVDYAAKIAPLFQEHCIDCHGKDDPDGEFNLESFESLIKGGKAGKVLEPGNAQDSLIVKFLEGRSGKVGKNQFMPPGKKEHLKTEEIALIRHWIDAGAPAPATEKKPADLIASLPKIAPKTEPKKAVQALAFSAKGNLIASGLFGSIQLLDATTKGPVRTLTPLAGKVNALVFSADGTTLFAAAGDAGLNGIAYQWKVSDGTLVRKYEGHTDAVYALALSPDGKTLATGGYDQKIKLWDVGTGAERMLLKGHNGGVFGLSFRPDGKVLASASVDRTVKLWEVASGKRLDTFSQPLKEQTAVAFSPDGKTVAAGGADNRIRVWGVTSAASEGSNKLLFTRYAHESAILNLIFSGDGKSIVSSAADKTVKFWDASKMAERVTLETQPDWSPALTLVDGGKHLALGRLDGSLAFYDLETGAVVAAAMKKPAAPAAAMKGKAAMKKPVAPGVPDITGVEPRGVQSGTTTKVRLTGRNLGEITAVKFSHPALSAKIPEGHNMADAVLLEVTALKDLPRAQYQVSVVTAKGESAKQTLYVDYLPQISSKKSDEPVKLEQLPLNIWGTLAETGQQDNYLFSAKQGQNVIFDLAAKRVESKMVSPRLEIFDTAGKLLVANNGLDSDSDPFIAFTPPRDGQYIARVREITLEGSPGHIYRLTAGVLPYVIGWWPLSVPPNQESDIHLVGYNLAKNSVKVKAGAEGDVMPPADTAEYRSRVNMKVTVSNLPVVAEVEPNDKPETAQPIKLPASINGRLFNEKDADVADADLYKIDVEKGQQVVMETRANKMGSPADTKIEVLDMQGKPVPMLLFQATKDSWLTLRSTDANAPGIRLGQFTEMALDDYMYFNGEILKIVRLARGPDADMNYYTNRGKRRDYFFTSPAAHGLDDVCYVVEPRRMGSKIVPNGLPTFTVNYANDDDSSRELGSDSYLIFTAPAKGSYLVRVSDTRGWSGDRYAYRLILRSPQPDFAVNLLTAAEVNIPDGSGVQYALSTDRIDEWDGDIRVDVSNVPEGFFMSSPVTIQAGHLVASGCLYALPGTKLGAHDFSKMKITATGTVNGKEVVKPVNSISKVMVTAAPKKLLLMEPDVAGKPAGDGKNIPQKPYEITIAPGTTVSAWLRVDRRGDDALIACDVENLPHGVIVDNIGLNGVQIRAGENEREIFLSCAAFVPEQDRLCHVIIGSARTDAVRETGAVAGFPILLKVRKPQPVVVK